MVLHSTAVLAEAAKIAEILLLKLEEIGKRRGSQRFAQRKTAIAENGAAQGEQNTTYCGSCLTCPTESGIFASAVVTK
jgi:hypothetical protein